MEDEPPGTSENPPVSEEDFVLVEVEEEEKNFPRSSFPPGFPRVGTNYKWPGLLKKAAPGYRSLPGFKNHDIQVARDLKLEREKHLERESSEEEVLVEEISREDSVSPPKAPVTPPKACGSTGAPEILKKARPLLPTSKSKPPGSGSASSAQPKSPIAPPPKKGGL